jgi:hypothetical protein
MIAASATMALAVGGEALAADAARPPAAAESRWGDLSLSTGIDYSTGKYGQASATDILYVPLTGKLETGGWTFKLTVPYISVTGTGNVVQGIGAFGRPKSEVRSTHSGLGDVVASVGKTVYDNGASGTLVDLTGKIKFGTADASQGLGTGANDYSFAIEPSQQFGPLNVFGSLGYKVLGSPSTASLSDVITASLGGSYKVAAATSAGLALDVQEAASGSSPGSQREVTAFVNHRLDDNAKAQVYLVRGLTSDSPDWGGGAMVSYKF